MSSNAKKLRVGVAGVGYLGRHHVRIYHELKDLCEFVGIFEVDDERATEVVDQYQCPRFSTLEEMAEACDAVSVVVPTDRHAEVSLPLLEGGCHLMVEKPICKNREEAAAILAKAREKELTVQVGHIEQYNPVTSFLEEAVHQPKFITADRLAPFNPRGTEVGVVLDLMIHDIGVILQLVQSPVERIEAVGVDVLSKSEDIANARIVFENGCVANINTSRVSLKKVREIRVFQPESYLSLDFMNQKGHLLRKGPMGLAKEDIPIEPGEPLRLELESFLSCLKDGSEPKVSGVSGLKALEIALEVTRQIREGQSLGK
ncbi:Gfo/Idh/MocA family protein [Puniceicoccus vermicola]|uniref:Gfo/Idh/MocA family oxidoreductase n=1 Tax=Puniceicoccus vermicola TaxID=388746 RepID=A0A7X1AX00_9BACT|nr:Gfo/Idh/MocA family oxidoreductase [Puniceicoccus vermicola]MBC2601314.1 Gfo/Idh/MocA family oxidoreductase [Puniceicoccus vermicola]